MRAMKAGRCEVEEIGDLETRNDADVDARPFSTFHTGVYGLHMTSGRLDGPNCKLSG
jgi:hypothetical protein